MEVCPKCATPSITCYDTLDGNNSSAFAAASHTHSISEVTGLQTTLDGKVDENAPITGATKTKVTYDSKGLVTAGADAAIADITGLQTALDGKVDENAAITPATKTKVTYDSKGLVTAGADAAIADITGLQTALDGKVASNAAITGATKTKVTYDSKGLVTAGADAAIADITGLQTALDGKVAGNAAITGATKTKITYDSKGLVTAGADATTADISDSTNKRYVTDAQLTVIGNTSGANTGDQNIFSTIAVAGQSNVVADNTNDTLTLVAGSNITITTDASTDSITIASTASGVSDGDKGDITVSGSGATWTVDSQAITLAKIQNISTSTLLGRVTAATGVTEQLTGTQATTLLDTFTSSLKGLAPASGGGTTNFLRADGTWAAPPSASSGTVLSPAQITSWP